MSGMGGFLYEFLWVKFGDFEVEEFWSLSGGVWCWCLVYSP